MAHKPPLNLWRSFLDRPNTDLFKTLGVAFGIAAACSVLVSATAVYLKPLHDANRLRESAGSLFLVIDSLNAATPQTRLINRLSGAYVDRAEEGKTTLRPDQDLAGLQNIENTLTAYEVRDQSRINLLVLPVRGAGYKSTLHGYLALKADLNTIAALTFYQHDETPGMGARITEKEWQALWRDKKIFDPNGTIRIRVVAGPATGIHEVDGITGATRTGVGVSNLVRFWLGENGYGPYLQRLRREAQG